MSGSISFTYLDLVDSTILFQPVMNSNWTMRPKEKTGYGIFTENEAYSFTLPGYAGERCILDLEMAETLSQIQAILRPQGFSLKVYDTYRPQKTVDYFIEWMESPDTPKVKQFHYPNTEKADFHELSYLSRTSSHTLGTAIDLTICPLTPQNRTMPKDFLGIWDPESLDMGVGYLAFDEKSSQEYPHLTSAQQANRALLRDLMLSHGFEDLDTEFWHYYFKRERNRHLFYDFDVRDDYPTDKHGVILLPPSVSRLAS